jgi:hypothetical protein
VHNLLRLSRLRDNSLRSLSSKLAHAALGALNGFGDPAAGALHGAVLFFAVDGAADSRASGFDLLDNGRRSGCDRAGGGAEEGLGDGERGGLGGEAHGALGCLGVAGFVAVDGVAGGRVGRGGGGGGLFD